MKNTDKMCRTEFLDYAITIGENKGVMISSKEAKSIVLPKRKPNDTTAY